MDKPVLILGSGGHATVLLDILISQNVRILGVVSPSIDPKRKAIFDFKHYGCDSIIGTYQADEIYLVNGVGSLPDSQIRREIQEKFTNLGYKFASLISDDAIVSPSVTFEEGVQVMAGVIIQASAYIGRGSIINTRAVVEHDCEIGSNNHIAPGVTLSGYVRTGHNVHVGTGANVIQNIVIGDNVVVGAGATVTKSIASNSKIFGFRSSAILNQGVLDES